MNMDNKTRHSLGTPWVTARSAELFDWAPDQVLKLFHPGFSADAAHWEKENLQEAHALGVTQVRCFGELEIEERRGLILKKIPGKTLTAWADTNPLNFFALPRVLARLHVQVHGGETQKLRDIKTIINECLTLPSMDFLSDGHKDGLRSYMATLPDGHTLLHLDFHTDNILKSKELETVIDWATAARGAVGADLAMTYFLFTEAELFPGITRFQEILYNTARKFIYRRYFQHYLALRGLEASEVMSQIRAWYLPIIVYRLATWQATTEVSRLQKKILEAVHALPSP